MRRRVVLLQLPIPQPGQDPARGNVPLAAGYLKMHTRRRGLENSYDIEIFPAQLANTLGDRGLVEALLKREPWLVGFTCYLWNVERSLWVARLLRERRPDVRVLVGGPEITADNDWVLRSPEVDFAAIGEGEQTFADLLEALRKDVTPRRVVPGLYVPPPVARGAGPEISRPLGPLPPFRQPLANLDEISSPYLEGILDAADERLLLLETIRGCIFKCKFCFYPKSYDDLYFASEDKIVANLRHASEHGAREVVLLDPTLNQRRDFGQFLRLLARCNPERRFTYFGELRAEGIDAEIASLLREANFTEVEIGLQSTDPLAQQLMDRKNHLRSFERAVRAMLDVGIHVKIDLIVGLPGDTVESVRKSLRYVHDGGLYSDVQVFNLAVLPGTAFRHEVSQLGLEFQPRPPYYVLRTPTLRLEDLYGLMAEAEELFDTEFDDLPPPRLPEEGVGTHGSRGWMVDLNLAPDARAPCPVAAERAQAFTLHLRSSDFERCGAECAALVGGLLADNPHTTLQVVLEATSGVTGITPALLERLRETCYRETTYLDRYYSIFPGVMKGSKRLVLLLGSAERKRLGPAWIESIAEHAAILWRGERIAADELREHEYLLGPDGRGCTGMPDSKDIVGVRGAAARGGARS